jgi:hypothetical protein
MAIFTPKCVISYPHLYTPQMPPNPRPGQKARFSCVLLFPAEMDDEDQKLLLTMQQAALAKAVEKWGSEDKVSEMMKMEGTHRLKWPFRKDNQRADGSVKWDNTKFRSFISPWSETQPGVVSRWADPNDPKRRPMKILDPSKVFAGCIVKASVNPFAYDQTGNRGVAFGLQNVQLWQNEGVERLDNRANAEDEFQAEAAPEGALEALSTPSTNGSGVQAAGGVKGQALSNLFT